MDIFGILGRAGRAYTVAVPDCGKETLIAKIGASTAKRSVFHTDEFFSDTGLSRYGEHTPIDHGGAFAEGPAGIEGFRS